jgi:hypothetical protein
MLKSNYFTLTRQIQPTHKAARLICNVRHMENTNMKIVGILLIFNALFLVTWWVVTDHPLKPWAVLLGLIAVFVGIYFTVQDRAIEITIEKVGTIKAAAQQAEVDAKAVADLRKRIEAQSATVDLVADSATKAHRLIEELSRKNQSAESKIQELDAASTAIYKTVAGLKETSDFMSLVAAAQNDDRIAFDKLTEWVDKKDSSYWQHAADAVVRIRTEYGGPILHGHMNVPWPKGTDPKTLSIARLRQEYRGAIRVYKADLVETVWKSEAIDKRDKLEFLVEVLKGDDSLGATFLAGKYFVEAVGDKDLKWTPFSTKPLLDWWEAHPNAFKQPK